MSSATRETVPAISRLRVSWRSALADRRLPIVLACVSVLLASPALPGPRSLDDHFHAAVLRREGPVPDAASPLGMFAFIDRDAARTRSLIERGVLPWWIGERTRIAFFRPLTELTHRVDHQLLGGAPRPMHAHDLLWAFALVLAAGVLYRRVLGPTSIAGLALVLYALDDAHGMPFAWTANRNAVMATLFGALAIAAHDRARREGDRRAAPLSWLFLTMSLACAEAGIATLAYLLAHALTLEPTRGWRRLLPITPAIGIVIAWRATSSWLGYGVVGSGLYVDPLHDPLRFAGVAIERIPLLLLGQWTIAPSDLDGALRDGSRPIAALAAAAIVLAILVPIARDIGSHAEARFFAIGMLASAVPIAATFPSDRLLFFVGLGAMGLLAIWLEHAARSRRLLAAALVGTHLVIAPLLLPVRASMPAWIAGYVAPCIEAPNAWVGEDVVLVNGLDLCPAYAPLEAALDDRVGARSVRTLAPGSAALSITRIDDHTLRVTEDGGLLGGSAERAFWDPDRAWHGGEERPFGAARVHIVTVTPDGRPETIELRSEAPLETTSRWLVVEEGGAVVPFTLPGVGESVRLAPVF